MKSLSILAALLLCTAAQAQNTSANHGHHGGLGSAMGAQAGASASAGQSGNGGRYAWVDLDASPVDQFQPFREADVRDLQKAAFVPYSGE